MEIFNVEIAPVAALATALINGIVLIVIIPKLRELTATAKESDKKLEKSREDAAKESETLRATITEGNIKLGEIKVVLMGIEGQGGMSRRVEDIGIRLHAVENAMQPILLERGMPSLEELQKRRRGDRTGGD